MNAKTTRTRTARCLVESLESRELFSSSLPAPTPHNGDIEWVRPGTIVEASYSPTSLSANLGTSPTLPDFPLPL